MISLKFIDGVLHQSIQMTPGGQWTDYNPVPSEKTPETLEQKLYKAFVNNNIYCSREVLKDLAEIAEQHFAQKKS